MIDMTVRCRAFRVITNAIENAVGLTSSIHFFETKGEKSLPLIRDCHAYMRQRYQIGIECSDKRRWFGSLHES